MLLTVTANPTIDKVYFVNELKVGEVHRPFKVTASAGGKGINVARVAKFLGEDSIALGFIGGSSGQFIKEEIIRLGIKEAFTCVKGESRTNFNISDNMGFSTELLESGPTVSKEETNALLEQFKAFADKSDIICVSGSLPKGADSSLYKDFIKIAKTKNKKIIVDTSGKVMLDIIDEAPFMIKPNKDELSGLLGFEAKDEADIKKALLTLYDKGIALPIITLGEDGAYAFIDNKFYRFHSPCVKVKNAVGSGDSTVAGIAVGISRGLCFKDAIMLGMACGVANTQFDETGFVSKELVDKYLKEISCEPV